MPRSRFEKVADRAVLPVFLLALVASFVVNDQESSDRDRAQAKQLVVGCIKNSKRTAVGAAGWHQLATRVRERNNPGDAHSADIYEATSVSMIETLPLPKGFKWKDAKKLAQGRYDATTKRIVLSPEALKLQQDGCVTLYK